MRISFIMEEPASQEEIPRKRSSNMYCFVPMCSSNYKKNPDKAFLSVPGNPVLRRKWLIAARRDMKKMPLSYSSHLRCCSDHFNLKEDAENYMRWKMMGGQIRLKKGVVPHIFKCQSRPVKVPLTERTVLRKRLVFDLLQASKATEPAKESGVICRSDGGEELSRKSRDTHCRNLHQHDTTADENIQNHFDKNQWEPHREDGKRKLKPNAVPTRFSSVKTPRKGMKKQKCSKHNEDEEVIEYIESLEAKKKFPRCVVCSRRLRESKKEFLSTQTSTSGLSLHQCLIGISDGKSTNIKDCSASDMVCFYCAHLINYADALEAELVKLKNAINGCLEIQNMNEEDQEMLKPEFDSHTAILDEYCDRVVGPGSAAEREDVVDEDQGSGLSEIVIENVTSIPEKLNTIQQEDKEKSISEGTKNKSELVSSEVEGDISNPEEIVPPETLPEFMCQICKLKTSSRSVLLFHLRRHMAHNKWCDFCDGTFCNEVKEYKPWKCDPT
ncbi:uncharacterized protein LOC124156340 isoform X2 [Ischnura elegans]|uniref:uncharacterized protein LOC124156340 isoform X2 n=2 Tax=Ischnura elegans TaxID=197161 RepID=UPI001ED889EA|nr:uncharacterized protein LOC124156340 isoform X2 [Ischnura elegans]